MTKKEIKDIKDGINEYEKEIQRLEVFWTDFLIFSVELNFSAPTCDNVKAKISSAIHKKNLAINQLKKMLNDPQ